MRHAPEARGIAEQLRGDVALLVMLVSRDDPDVAANLAIGWHIDPHVDLGSDHFGSLGMFRFL